MPSRTDHICLSWVYRNMNCLSPRFWSHLFFMILWKVVYLYSGCRRDNSFVPEFLWNPLFVFSVVTLNQVSADYFFVGITGKGEYFYESQPLLKRTHVFILILSFFVLFYRLRNWHTFLYWPLLLPTPSITSSRHHIALQFLHSINHSSK